VKGCCVKTKAQFKKNFTNFFWAHAIEDVLGQNPAAFGKSCSLSVCSILLVLKVFASCWGTNCSGADFSSALAQHDLPGQTASKSAKIFPLEKWKQV